MIPSRSGTEEGRGHGKVKGKKSGCGRFMWMTPVLLALPAAAGMVFASIKYGSRIRDLIQVAVKLMVTR